MDQILLTIDYAHTQYYNTKFTCIWSSPLLKVSIMIYLPLNLSQLLGFWFFSINFDLLQWFKVDGFLKGQMHRNCTQ